MNSVRIRFRFFFLTYIAVLVLGTLCYAFVENVSFVDAFYFSIVTIATVGYGDIHPVTTAGKLMTVLLIVTGVGTFLGVVANATEIMLNRREQQARVAKLNMVLEVFFSEAGKTVLSAFAQADPAVDAIRNALIVKGDWSDATFSQMRQQVRAHECRVEIAKIDLERMRGFLIAKRDFLVRLLENPVLMEHESFTDLLMAVFHLTEELACRETFADMPEGDRVHIAGDMQRAYGFLVMEYLGYMKYLKTGYPYLFSLAIRTNPFDRNASVVVR